MPINAPAPTKDSECVALLQWVLPRLQLCWPGYRKVRRQVCRRITRRMRELGLSGIADYRDHLARANDEWAVLDRLCFVTISRFFRDRKVFDALGDVILPELARLVLKSGESRIRVWSAGCAGGEEAFSVKLLWELAVAGRFPGISLEIVGTDANPEVLERARAGCYGAASLRSVPGPWLEQAFDLRGDVRCLREVFRKDVTFVCQDIRREFPAGPFQFVLCRNLALTYFDQELQRIVLQGISDRIVPSGVLVTGIHESLPEGSGELAPWHDRLAVYRKGVPIPTTD